MRSELSKWLKEHGYKTEEANSVITELIKKSHKFEGKSLQYALSELQPTISAIDDEKARKKTRAEFVNWLKAQRDAGRFSNTKAKEFLGQFDDKWDTFTGTTLNDVLKALNLSKDNPKQSSVSLNVSSPSNGAAKTAKASKEAGNAVIAALSGNEANKARETAKIVKEGRDALDILDEMERRSEFSRRALLGMREGGEKYMSSEALSISVDQKELDAIRKSLNQAIKESSTSPKKAKQTIEKYKEYLNHLKKEAFSSRRKIKTTNQKEVKKILEKYPKSKKLANKVIEIAKSNPKDIIKLLESNKVEKANQRQGYKSLSNKIASPNNLFGAKTPESLATTIKLINNALVDRIEDATKNVDGKTDNLKYILAVSNEGPDSDKPSKLMAAKDVDYKQIKQDSKEITSDLNKVKKITSRINNYMDYLRKKYGYSDIVVKEKDKDSVEKYKNNLQATLSATLMWLRREPGILIDAARGINNLNKTENME